MKKLLSILTLIFLIGTATMAQKPVVGQPYSFTHKDVSYNIDRVDLPAIDVQALKDEDAKNSDKGLPYRVGIVRNVHYTFNNCGRVDILPDGSKLWRLTLNSPNALMLNVYFSTFNIPEGATFYIYSGDRSQLTGTYTNADVQENGVLASEDILGDEVTLEYHEPANAAFKGEIVVDRLSHIYRDFLNVREESKGYWGDAEGTCHYNVACPQGDGWRDQIKSVVFIMITGSTGTYYCSGATINNTRMDKTPYVLTANHCLDGTSSTFKFYFNYQTLTCEGTTGYYNRMANGGTIKARADLNTSSDFMLLQITGNLGTSYRDSIYFAGWDATGTASVGRAIHHPGGDYKKLSIPRVVFTSGNKYWTVAWYTNPNEGCTEQGSSGSPLFNANKMIIGDLSTGSSACDYPQGTDNYGKFSYSFTNNNTSNNAAKLKPWLDPDNTGALTCVGMSYDGTVGIENINNSMLTFSIAPTPTSGMITVKGNFENTTGICNVYNTMGQLVSSSNESLSSSFSMNFDSLPNGLYFVEIISNHHIYKSKLVISK